MRPAQLRIAVLLLIAISSCYAFEWEECPDQKSSVQKAVKVLLTPEPVPAGTTANFTIIGVSEVSVEHGDLDLHVYYLGIQVYHKKIDLPGKINIGPFVSKFQEDFPSITPPGSYKVKIQSQKEDGSPLLCLIVHFKVVWGGSLRSSLSGGLW